MRPVPSMPCLLLLLSSLLSVPALAAERLPPVGDVAAAERAFQLFYRERVERAMVAYNRYALVGDSLNAGTIGRVAVAREGDRYEIVPGPVDNNRIGTSTFATWQAYRVFRSRPLELSLVRMFEGMAFVEEVTGVPGLTSREAVPGWTRVMDGLGGRVDRSRDGVPVSPPTPPPASLEAEVLRTFFGDGIYTYRENPADTFLSFQAVDDVVDYSITYSFDELPGYLRVSDCCSSFMRTPEGYPWAGGFWGNHNSRDNLPDLTLGYIAAMEAAADPRVPLELRLAAQHAVRSGQRVGDLIAANDGAIMTISERSRYGRLTVSGAVRPDGTVERQDLGSLASCQRAYGARAISSDGLRAPFPEIPIPGAIDAALGPLARVFNNCEVPDADPPTCSDLLDGLCGLTVGELPRLEVFGVPWLDLVAFLNRLVPGLGETIVGGFQDDWEETTWAALALVEYGRVTGRPEVERAARQTLADHVAMMRRFGELAWGNGWNPARLAEHRYRAALLEAAGGLEPERPQDFEGFERADHEIARIEDLLDFAPTAPRPLLDDATIRDRVESRLAGLEDDRYGQVRYQRYRDAYGFDPPIRRAGDAYEARTGDGPWRPVPNISHRTVGGLRLLDEMVLCHRAPELLDCTWASLGCAHVDLTGDGAVDAADVQRLIEIGSGYGEGASCGSSNGWCGGADLDRTGVLDELDLAFAEAAEGCRPGP